MTRATSVHQRVVVDSAGTAAAVLRRTSASVIRTAAGETNCRLGSAGATTSRVSSHVSGVAVMFQVSSPFCRQLMGFQPLPTPRRRGVFPMTLFIGFTFAPLHALDAPVADDWSAAAVELIGAGVTRI